MNAWGVLKQAVKDAPAGSTIKITGTIQAATASGNNGELEITKDLTIEAKSGTATLDANSSALGSNAHRIFKVTGGNFKLYNMVLQSGNAGENEGGGIYVSGGELILSETTIKNCIAQDGGGVYVRGQGSGSGTHATFTLNGGTIGDNYAGFGGGVMVTAGGSCTMKDGTISRNRANYGGGVCAKKEDSADGVFTMKNGTITGNRAYQDGGAAEVHGIFTWEGGDITGNYVNTAPRGQIIHRDGGIVNNPHHYTES